MKFSRTTPLLVRFWSQIEKTKTCWLWIGSTDGDGYGVIGANGKVVKVHRLSYEIHFGEIPNGVDILHECDVRNCVKPKHLFQGNNAINVADRVAKGRSATGIMVTRNRISPRGVGHYEAKLTDRSVLMAREQHSKGESFAQIAKKLNVNRSTIRQAVIGETWKHVAGRLQ